MAKLHWRLTDENRERFLAHLDQIPPEERPVYVIHGQMSSLWHTLGGGTSQMFVIFLMDRVVISKRSSGRFREKGHQEWPLTEIADVDVSAGPFTSSVEMQFRDGSKTKVTDVSHKAAEPMSRYMADGLAVFDPAVLDRDALEAFAVACRLIDLVPKEIFK